MKFYSKTFLFFFLVLLFSSGRLMADPPIPEEMQVSPLSPAIFYSAVKGRFKDICGTTKSPSNCENCNLPSDNTNFQDYSKKCDTYLKLCGNVGVNTCERIPAATLQVIKKYEAKCGGDLFPSTCERAGQPCENNQCTELISAYREKCNNAGNSNNNETPQQCRERLSRFTVLVGFIPGALAPTPAPEGEGNENISGQGGTPTPPPGGGNGTGGGLATPPPASPGAANCALNVFSASMPFMTNTLMAAFLLIPVFLRFRKKR